MIPQFLVLKNFPLVGGNNIFGQGGQGLINHYAAIILPGAVGAYAVFFMKQFFETLPDELAEAARVDGCSEFRIFWNIYLPLILPAAVTLGIMTFQSGWNSFMWPMIVPVFFILTDSLYSAQLMITLLLARSTILMVPSSCLSSPITSISVM